MMAGLKIHMPNCRYSSNMEMTDRRCHMQYSRVRETITDTYAATFANNILCIDFCMICIANVFE